MDRESAGAAIERDEVEEPAGGSGMVMRMVRFVSKMIKWSTPSKERHGEKKYKIVIDVTMYQCNREIQ